MLRLYQVQPAGLLTVLPKFFLSYSAVMLFIRIVQCREEPPYTVIRQFLSVRVFSLDYQSEPDRTALPPPSLILCSPHAFTPPLPRLEICSVYQLCICISEKRGHRLRPLKSRLSLVCETGTLSVYAFRWLSYLPMSTEHIRACKHSRNLQAELIQVKLSLPTATRLISIKHSQSLVVYTF